MEAEMPNYLYHVKDDGRVQAVIDQDWKSYCEWLEEKEPNQPPEPTAPSGRGSA